MPDVAGIVRKIRRQVYVVDVDHGTFVFSLNVLLNVRRLLGYHVAVGTLESRWLAALVSQVCHQAGSLAIDTGAIQTRKSHDTSTESRVTDPLAGRSQAGENTL